MLSDLMNKTQESDPPKKEKRLMSKLILSTAMLFILCYCSAIKVDAVNTTRGTGDDIVINGHDLRKTVDEVRDFFTEVTADRVEIDEGVFDDVVQQPRGD